MTQPTMPPDPARARSRWVWLAVPGTLVVLIVGMWVVLSLAPFGKRQETLTRSAPPAPEVIAEGTDRTATTSQIVTPGEPPEVVPTTTTSVPLAQTVPEVAAPATAPAQAPPPVPAPQKQTAPPPEKQSPQLTETDAEDAVRRYVTSRDYYGVSGQCMEFANQGFSNRGYTIDVVEVCNGRGRLGRWRIDTLTREVFVQKSDGRFLRP